MMDIDFPLVLVLSVLITGALVLIDRLFLLPRRKRKWDNYRKSLLEVGAVTDAAGSAVARTVKQPCPAPDQEAKFLHAPAVIDVARSIFPVLLVVLVLRSFLFEPFQIPSGSMKPTLEVGDFILVNKFNYGLRLPVLDWKIVGIRDPERGDVMVFKEPDNPNTNFIKRVIGLPGDTIRYEDKQLFINGEPINERLVAQLRDEQGIPYKILEEELEGLKHYIREDPLIRDVGGEGKWVVPEGHYFMMGDNRDRSNDSRFWGFVPDRNIVGQAVAIWMHWPSWGQLPSFRNNGWIH
jgi:signal peptidase I